MFEKIEEFAELMMSTSVLTESRGISKVQTKLKESEVTIQEWNRREAAREAFESEFEERETTFERRTIKQSPLIESRIEMTEAIKTQTELQESESWVIEKRMETAIWVQNWTELQLEWNKRTVRCKSEWRKGMIRTSGEAVETRRRERRAIEESGVVDRQEETDPTREETVRKWEVRARGAEQNLVMLQWKMIQRDEILSQERDERERNMRRMREEIRVEVLSQERKERERALGRMREEIRTEAEARVREAVERIQGQMRELEQERDELKHKLQLLQEQERAAETKQKGWFW
jgi:hypothetical protein